MSVLESKDLDKIPKSCMIDFVQRGLLDRSAYVQRKHPYVAQEGEKEKKEQFIK
jgi:hypothetical protein